MRDNNWLKAELQNLLKKYFSEVKITNPIEIRFGREAKYRFGSIKLMKGSRGTRGIRRQFSIFNHRLSISKGPAKSIITITSMFRNQNIPVEVVEHTIAHELCHYAHGFSSTNKRLFKFPHHGGIVDAELKRRGAGDLITAYKKWLKDYRKTILASRNTSI